MTRIQIRRDTSNNWATYNPILADGEFALETDTRKLKIGNGEQPYNDLAYQGGGVTDAYTKTETDELLDTKQDILTDLSTIRNGASLGATALQPGANISELTNNSNYLVNNFSNLSSEGLDKLNQSKALETGSVSSDADIYADVLKRAHSTFDKSKFTVVGSPTITDDGFVSNFTTTNYINTGIVIGENNFIIKGSFICSDVTKQSTIISIPNGWYPNVFVNQGVFTSWSKDINGNSLDIILTTIQQNILYKFEYSFDGTKYTLSLFNSDNTLISTKSFESNNYIKNINTQPVYIGILASPKGNPFYGSIDLKSIAIWADGIPVFNGNITGTDTINNIEIPYTLSKTGSKIVDVAYRDKVQQVYEQTGEALFYTLDEQNQNFTLPMGEIYGMITKNKEEASYTLPPATADTLGVIKVGDNLSITEDGVLNATGSTPSNMVTTDTEQTITGIKTFPAYTKFNDTIQFTGDLCRIQNEYGNNLFLDDRVGNTIQLGEESRTTILSNTVQNGSGKKFLVQGSITSGSDNLVISETTEGIQIASTNNIGNLKYWTGVETDYTALETKNADTLYRTTDTNKVYLGTIQLGG